MHPAIAHSKNRDHYQGPGNDKPSVDIRHPMATYKRNDNSMPNLGNDTNHDKRTAIGRRLKSGMIDKGFKPDEFAQCLGVSKQTLYSYFNGDKMPTFERAIDICDLLDWPLDRLAVRREEA